MLSLMCVYCTEIPEIEVMLGVTEVFDDSDASTALGSDFGDVGVGSSSSPSVYTVNNIGVTDLIITSTTVTGTNSNNFVLGGTTSGTVSAGTSATFSVTATPDAPGTRVGNIRIASNDATEAQFDFAVTVNGLSKSYFNYLLSDALFSSILILKMYST